jgi:beta-ureidopropionase / N-carbamoyl-L-amino-acid hydrolase
VTSIVGIRRIEVVFEGAADHAGTTPMALRHDGLVAAASTVAAVRRIAEQLAAEGSEYFVATVGILSVEPGASNVVPGRCRLIIDARITNSALTRSFVVALERDSTACAAAARVERTPLVTLSDAPPVACDPVLRQALRRAAEELGLGETDLASGAGHDAAFMSRICPVGHDFRRAASGQDVGSVFAA